MLVLLPIMFVHVGILRASLIMLASTILQGLSARFTLEATRLQHGNLNLGKNEDFETLTTASISSAAFPSEKSLMVSLATKLYPIKLVLHSALTIMVCTLVADQVASQFFAGDGGAE